MDGLYVCGVHPKRMDTEGGKVQSGFNAGPSQVSLVRAENVTLCDGTHRRLRLHAAGTKRDHVL